MCTQVQNCEEVARLRDDKANAVTKYWAVISGLLGLVITLVVFYANTSNAMTQVQDHEQRLRIMEQTAVRSETLLQQIATQVVTIDAKLDKHIEYKAY